jgi:putative oxidoreductase
MSNELPSSHPLLSCTDAVATSWREFLLFAGRVMLGAIFVLSGTIKNLGIAPYSTRGWPAEWFFGPLGATVELIGGVLIILGLGTRYAALLMMLFVIIASFSSHRFWEFADPAQFRVQQSQFFKNVSIFGGFVLLFVVGTGRWSIDHLLRRGK